MSNERKLTSRNPYTGNIIKEYSAHSEEEVKSKIDEAHAAFPAWREQALEKRIERVRALKEVIERDKQALAELAVAEMGKPLKQSIAEVEKCAWLCEHYADHAEEYLRDDIIKTDASESWVSYEPLGVILAVMPWNFPYWQVMRFAVPTLLAGNTGVLKHASNVQGCSEAIEKLFKDSGFPKGVFSHLKIGGSRVSEVVENPLVRAATLTGSEKAGKSLAKVAGEHLKKSVLELGGSNAFIILKDADIDAVMDTAVFARVQNNGQSCIAAKRFLIEDEVYGEFTSKYLEKIKNLKVGDPMKKETEVGPMARVDLAELLEDQMNESIEAGAKLLYGGKREKAMFHPAVLEGVKPGMRAFDEETFGPLVCFTRVKSAEEAIELNNRSNYGLGATICTSDLTKAKVLAREIEDGAVFINELVKSDPRLPFGGTKISGYGRELGPLGIKEFVNAKTYYIK